MTVAPCPDCNKRSGLVLISGVEPNSLVIQCSRCDYTLILETKFPCDPEEVINEWNRKVSE